MSYYRVNPCSNINHGYDYVEIKKEWEIAKCTASIQCTKCNEMKWDKHGKCVADSAPTNYMSRVFNPVSDEWNIINPREFIGTFMLLSGKDYRLKE